MWIESNDIRPLINGKRKDRLTLPILKSEMMLTWPSSGFWRPVAHRVLRVGFDMLLEILWTLEGLSTELTLVRLERYVDTNMGRDMIALDRGGTTAAPTAGQVQVIRALATDVTLADVVLARVSCVRYEDTGVFVRRVALPWQFFHRIHSTGTERCHFRYSAELLELLVAVEVPPEKRPGLFLR